MGVIAAELEQRLLELDAESAAKLERVIHDLLDLSRPDRPGSATGPVGYFEETAGCFEGEPFEAAEDSAPVCVN